MLNYVALDIDQNIFSHEENKNSIDTNLLLAIEDDRDNVSSFRLSVCLPADFQKLETLKMHVTYRRFDREHHLGEHAANQTIQCNSFIFID